MKITKETKNLIERGVKSFCPWYGDGKDDAYHDLRQVVKTNEPVILEVEGKIYVAHHVSGEPSYIYVNFLDNLSYIKL